MFIKHSDDVYTLKSNLEKLDEISKLEKDWNGYGAEPIDERLIKETRSILNGLGDLPQPFVSPFGGGGGIQIEWEKKDKTYLEIEIKSCTDYGEENKYDAFICLSPKEESEELFQYNLTGTVLKKQESINNLVKLFYGR